MTTPPNVEVPPEVDMAVAAELAELRAAGMLVVQPPNRRSRVCDDEPTKRLINQLLSRLHTYRDVYLIINDSINPARRARGERPITQRIIKNHAQEHFPIENPAWALFQKIGRKRAHEMNKDFEDGVGGYVTHLAYLEVLMHRGFEDLVDPRTKVSYEHGANAAVKLADLEAKTAGERERSEMLAQMHRIITLFKETVPAEEWPAILAKLNGEIEIEGPRHVASQRMDDDDDDDEFDPGDDEDFDDDDG